MLIPWQFENDLGYSKKLFPCPMHMRASHMSDVSKSLLRLPYTRTRNLEIPHNPFVKTFT